MKNNIYHRTAPPVITPDMTGAALKAISSVPDYLPFLVILSAGERKAMNGMDVGNKAFSDDALAAARLNRAILPPYHSVERFENQIAAFGALDIVIQEVADLLGQLRDTRLAMGAAAYQTALSLYHYFDQARKDGVPGAEAAYQQLAPRFKRQGKRKAKEAESGKAETS